MFGAELTQKGKGSSFSSDYVSSAFSISLHFTTPLSQFCSLYLHFTTRITYGPPYLLKIQLPWHGCGVISSILTCVNLAPIIKPRACRAPKLEPFDHLSGAFPVINADRCGVSWRIYELWSECSSRNFKSLFLFSRRRMWIIIEMEDPRWVIWSGVWVKRELIYISKIIIVNSFNPWEGKRFNLYYILLKFTISKICIFMVHG